MPNKKIFDIIPPQKVELERKEIIKETPKIKKPSHFPIGKILIFILIPLILAGGLCFLNLSKAEIEIWPQLDSFSFKEKVGVSQKVDKIDLNSRFLPGKVFEVEKEVFQDFSSSGKILKKAEGAVRVYNNYQKDQVLVKNSRFISANGKLFYSQNRILVPAGKYIDVEVIAAQAGKEYNIEPTTFSIPGLAGLPQYHVITGKSFAAMTGGGEVSVISQEDLDKAKDSLTKELITVATNSLKEEMGDDFIFLEEATSQEISEISGANVGEEKDKFTLRVKGKIKTLSFKKSDLENFAKEFILSQQASPGKEFYRESLKLNWKIESVDLNSNKITLSVEGSGKVYSIVDENSLKEAILGKSLNETKILLMGMPQIVNSQVRLSPFWVKKVPMEIEKVKIKLMLD